MKKDIEIYIEIGVNLCVILIISIIFISMLLCMYMSKVY